jgi:hypothetical protein
MLKYVFHLDSLCTSTHLSQSDYFLFKINIIMWYGETAMYLKDNEIVFLYHGLDDFWPNSSLESNYM